MIQKDTRSPFMTALAVTAATALLPSAAAAASMATGGRTSQPIGHYEFCRANPDECLRLDDKGPAKLDAAAWKAIRAINLEVNKAVTPMTDLEMHGKDEVWSYPGAGGDCEDYALEKRRRIAAEAGVSLSNLLMTVVRRANGEGHAVLTLRTTEGDFVLDNLNDDVKDWRKAKGYRFLKRQDSSHSGKWVSIERSDADAPVTAGAP